MRKTIILGLWLSLLFSFPVAGSERQLKLGLAKARGKVENNIVAMRVLEEAYQKIGYKIKIIEIPGKRSLAMSNRGELDGELHRIDKINIQYPNLIQIPVSIVSIPQSAFAKKDIKIDGWESLRPYTIGLVRGYILAERYTQGMKHLHPITTWEQGFKMLDADRIDVIVSNKYRGFKLLRELNIQDIHPLDPPLAVTPMYHYLHIKHIKIVPQITLLLRAMRKEGRIETIISQVEEEFKEKRSKHQNID